MQLIANTNSQIYTNKKMGSDGTVIEEQEIPTYASSLPVPNVQEIVRSNPLNVPERYIRDEEEMLKSTDKIHLSSEIPIIDLSLLSNEDEIKKLDLACKDWGFFQVINHGIPNEVLQSIKDTAAGFFDLPLEEKNKYSMPANDIQGYGHAYVVSEEQKLDWTDTLILITFPSKFRRLNFWPNKPQDFKETIETYSNGIRRVGIELLYSISLSMGMKKDTLIEHHKELMQGIRMNYYPTCSKPDHVMGLSPHSDTSTITILLQEDNVNGLQIRHDGEWIPVKPIPNALVVNIGDVIEIWSNGKYKSIEHRAVTNENKSRLSFASFLFPHDDVELEPFDQIVESDGSRRMYKKVKYGDFLRQSMKRKHEGKAHTQMAKNET